MKKILRILVIVSITIFLGGLTVSCKTHKHCDAYGHQKQVMNNLHKASDKV
jgi:uncharacterized protein YxeA